ncbi:MAG: AraC family transcriptional regulator [Opitutaceae bacterium]
MRLARSYGAHASPAGFNDGNYFARQFRARMGCTPREWRKKQVYV